MIETLKNNQKLVKEVFSKFLDSKSHRKTPERFSILKEIYDSNDHFDIDTLHAKMSNKNYKISKATLYNTIELLLECRLVKRHQFDSNISKVSKFLFIYPIRKYKPLLPHQTGPDATGPDQT